MPTPDLKLARVDLGGSPDSALVITGTARYPLVAVAAGEVSTLPVEKLVPWRFEGKFDSPKRTQPIFFRYPRREVLTVDLHLPTNSKIDELPSPGSFDCALGSWETRWSRIADGVRYERLVDIRYGERSARNFNSRRRRPIASRRLECGDCGCQVTLKLTPDDRLRSHHPHAPAVRQCQSESGPKDPPQRHAQHPRQANERVVIGIDELAAGFRVKGRERAVAKRPDASADAIPSLENRHVGPSPRQFPCGDQSGETGTDDHDAAAAKR